MSDPVADPVRLLAEAQAARDLLRDRPAAASPGAAALWRHVRRRPGEPVAFAVERAIRADPAVARRYRTMLGAGALAHAPTALAASDGALDRRRVGPYELTLDAADTPPLLVIACGDAPAPGLIEVSHAGETVRLGLPDPVAGSVVIALDPGLPDAALLGRLLAERRSEVFLV